jgi:F-type H+-transporting ATPase subunit a
METILKTAGVLPTAHKKPPKWAFMAIHVDSLAWSLGLGVLFCWMFRYAAKRATTGVPSGFLNFIELVVEFIDSSVKDSFHWR